MIDELWLDCVGMGFNATPEKLRAIFDGTEPPSRYDYDVIAQCLNERLKDLDVGTLVPYGDEIDM